MRDSLERRAVKRRAEDRAPETVRYINQLEAQNTRLKSLLNVSKEMMQEMHLDRLLEIIMDRVTSVMNAERSSLFLLDHKTDELYARVAQGMNVSSVRFPNGVGLAGHVGKTGQTINIADAYKDPRFNRDFDKKTGFRTRAILSMPIKNTRGKIIGVSQVLNK
ncbi:MAG TPA: GAF domain-containing protein, partial [Leptospiraceae bacterium]|nr:GAF domain-containing protein [Leptospiraceae bacterium]